jgi:hypothetical protein
VPAPRILPWSWYSDPDVLRREQERIFRRTWQYVGHVGRLEEVGDRFAAWAGDVPVLVVRAEDRVLVERVQKGVRSGMLEEGRLLGESEQLVARFQELVGTGLA